MDTGVAAEHYIERDWQCVPIGFQEKGPKLAGWQNLRNDDTTLPTFKYGGRKNIGVLLGVPSNGLIDIDLDTLEAVSLAPHFLPPTGAVFGRPGKPRSHWLYTGDDPPRTVKFSTNKACFVEVRGTGGQTLFPGSVHPSGESIEWHTFGEAKRVDLVELEGRVRLLAVASLFASRWPAEGQRHEAALAIAGAMYNSRSIPPDEIEDFVDAVATAGGSSPGHNHRQAARSTVAKAATGGNIFGWPRVASLFDQELVDDARDWLGCVAPQSISVADEDVVRWEPFPLELLPPALRRVVEEGAKALECDPSLIALPALAASAGSIGNFRDVEVFPGSWYEPCILWAVAVVKSGELKTPAMKVALRAVYKGEDEALAKYQSEMETYAEDKLYYDKELANWRRCKEGTSPPRELDKPVRPQLVVSDVTVEAIGPLLVANPRGLLLARDELSGWIGGFNQYKGGVGGDAAQWLEMHSRGRVTVNRKSEDHVDFTVPDACLSLCGTIQPGVLTETLGKKHRDSGMAARMLFAMPPSRVRKMPTTAISEDAKRNLAKMYRNIRSWEPGTWEDDKPKPITVMMSPEAKAQFAEWFNTHNADKRFVSDPDLAAAYSKLEGMAARLALVHHCCRVADGQNPPREKSRIDGESMAAGVGLCRWFRREAGRVYGLLDVDVVANFQLTEFIETFGNDGVTARDLCRWKRAVYPNADAAALTLEKLARERSVVRHQRPTGPRGGRPTECYRAVPRKDVSPQTPKSVLDWGGEGCGCVTASPVNLYEVLYGG